MAQVTKQFTENSGNNRAVWTLQANGTNVKASENAYKTVNVPWPTIKANYSYSGKTHAQISLNRPILQVGAYTNSDYAYDAQSAWQAWAPGVQKTLGGGVTETINIGTIFNASNKNSRTVSVYLNSRASAGNGFLNATSAKNADASALAGSYEGYCGLWGSLATVTLDAPPTCSYTQVTSNTSGKFYKNVSTATVNISNLTAKYGGDIKECKLTIGNQSVNRLTNGALSIKLNATGTFTPKLTLKDSRGQTTTYTLNAITVTMPPVYAKYAGTWKATLPVIKDSGKWKNAKNIFIKHNGTWKKVL